MIPPHIVPEDLARKVRVQVPNGCARVKAGVVIPASFAIYANLVEGMVDGCSALASARAFWLGYGPGTHLLRRGNQRPILPWTEGNR